MSVLPYGPSSRSGGHDTASGSPAVQPVHYGTALPASATSTQSPLPPLLEGLLLRHTVDRG